MARLSDRGLAASWAWLSGTRTAAGPGRASWQGWRAALARRGRRQPSNEKEGQPQPSAVMLYLRGLQLLPGPSSRPPRPMMTEEVSPSASLSGDFHPQLPRGSSAGQGHPPAHPARWGERETVTLSTDQVLLGVSFPVCRWGNGVLGGPALQHRYRAKPGSPLPGERVASTPLG